MRQRNVSAALQNNDGMLAASNVNIMQAVQPLGRYAQNSPTRGSLPNQLRLAR